MEVLWKGKWYKARIKNIDSNGHYNIHYQGYGDEWDATVNPNRVRRLSTRGKN